MLRAGRREVVRLNGIDAPEMGQALGDRARQFTAELAFGQVVQVVVRDHDRYGRTVADVVLADGCSLSHEVVRGGYAWWFRRYSALLERREPGGAAVRGAHCAAGPLGGSTNAARLLLHGNRQGALTSRPQDG